MTLVLSERSPATATPHRLERPSATKVFSTSGRFRSGQSQLAGHKTSPIWSRYTNFLTDYGA
jgi:hypothetical protein